MKKNAFTLAEALICLAVIGVVASLTIPSLANNIEKNKVGPAFAKAVNNIESANKMALYKWGARTLSEVAKSVEGHTEASYFDVVLKPVYQWGTMPEKTFWFKDVLNPTICVPPSIVLMLFAKL